MKAAIIFLTCLLFMEGFGLYRSVTRRKRLVTTCKKTEYRCGSGDCINEELLCDGTEDCPDGSDETISCKNIPCPSYSFSCTYGACIDPKLRCNGVSDCRDNSDENGCDRILVKRSPIISDSSGNVLPPNSCFLPQHPEHGKWIALHSSTVQPGDIVEINTVIAFSCDTNYKLVPYVTLSLCLPDWTILPKCLNICPSLVPTEGMSLSCSNNGAAISCDNPTDGTKATIKCKNPGGSNPKPVTTCHDGKWDHPLPDCIARTCPTLKPGKYMNLSCSINGASNSCDDPVEGTVATIKCAENYEDATLVSKKFRYCSDGSWDSPLPNCRPVCGKRPVSEGEELVNGNNTNRTTFPWHLGIYKNNEYICGGSLITPKLVLTAAHCFRSPYSSHTSIETYTVGAGKYYRKYNETRDSFAQFSRVSELIIHKNFNNGEPYLEFDFAVLVLAKSFQLSKYVLPACLDINNIDISTLNDHEGVVMGWGYTNEVERPSDTLHSLEVEYKTTKTCNLPDGFKFFYLPYAKDKLCAGAQGRSVCKGDSGGGLVFQNGSGRYVLRGIISTMPSNGLACNPNQDTLYTSVQYHLRDILQLIKRCDLNCGLYGHCVSAACQCDSGWGGEACNIKLCDPRCNEHGQCQNGTCLCFTGRNGKHCTMEGCPYNCSGHGQCLLNFNKEWECRCENGWDGPDCSIVLEQNCNDTIDNDNDGFIDCQDPECCSSHLCKDSQLCVSSPEPVYILHRKQPPAITASFFDRLKFIIDEGSLQNYVREQTFNKSRSAVIRGRVVTQMGMGLIGILVRTTETSEGFTLTRKDGWFDLMVNGGGAVTLQFSRYPFWPQSQIVLVPWNEVVIIDNVIFITSEENTSSPIPQPCVEHDFDIVKPILLTTWKYNFQGACPDKSAILVESQVVQESIQIPGTGLNLVYHSSRAVGYLSTIQLQLTPETIPSTLNLVHLRIIIEGIVFEKTFEADPIIKFTYVWNRRDVYDNRVYRVATAIVKIGYQYIGCRDTIWNVQTTKLNGHDMGISEVGGWNFDIHHRYNFHEGILQKGDGTNVYLKHKLRVIVTTMGDGHRRPLYCTNCEGEATKQRLLAPVALATGPDGSIFVGDFNLVRKIQTDGTVRTLLKLNATRVSYRYHMALSPLDGTLYISDPESSQIILVRNLEDYNDSDNNWETVIGSGEHCLPGDEALCGDGALARNAKLAYPKGIAFTRDNMVYFADGTNIRMVDRDGIVTTVIGNHMHKSHWKPMPCKGTLSLEEVHLRWPTELSINPIDNSLHFIDDHMILQLTLDGRVKVVAGRPLHCALPLSDYDTELATHSTLVMPQSIAFNAVGDLFVVESDSQRINRVRVIETDGKISPYAGVESKCNCQQRRCDCFEADHYLALNSKFNTISSVAISPDGHVHIADQANYRIRSIIVSLPNLSPSREYKIFSPETKEIYIFNHFGQHNATKNLITGETNHLFTYNLNAPNGKLSAIIDAAGNIVSLLRDYTNQVKSIENSNGQKFNLKIFRKIRMLHELSTPNNYNVTLYYDPTCLIKTKLDGFGRSYFYNYDEFGRVTSAITPTGRIISLSFDLRIKNAMVQVKQNNRKPTDILIKGSSVSLIVGKVQRQSILLSDGSVKYNTPWSRSVSTDTVPFIGLTEIESYLEKSYQVPAKQRSEIGGNLVNRIEWKYFLHQIEDKYKNTTFKGVTKVGQKLCVNGENLLAFQYDRDSALVSVFTDDGVSLFNATYNRTAGMVKWTPTNGIFSDVELEYDRFGRFTSWKWGDISETYGFDSAGRLFEIRYGDGSLLIYTFKNLLSSLPFKITTPRGSDYALQYDKADALQSITTPRGHTHTFSLQSSLGFFKYQYFSPSSTYPYEIIYNDEGQILTKVYPHQSGRVVYAYDTIGKLETSLAGLSSIHYIYHEETGLVKNIDITEQNFELKTEFKYQAGVLKDEKLKFNSKSGLENAHFKYSYDGNARLSSIDVDINGKKIPQLILKYNQNLGILEGIGDLRIYRNTSNRSKMQDLSQPFFRITDYDDHGRIKSILINIKSFDVFRLDVEYDKRNRITTQKISVERATSIDRIIYNADGHVLEVVGSSISKYVYDKNGNVVVVTNGKQRISLSYDSGDRVVQYDNVEFYNYDIRGYVVRRGEQKFRYNSRGQLIHAIERDKFQAWYYYDDRGRLVSWNNDKGNVTQFFYSNPSTPELVSCVHFPKSGQTFRFLYDQRDVVVTVETNERYYVASDQNGSPLALYDVKGNIIKQIKRTPFGHIITDTNPDFYLPVDFYGGIYDPNTKLVYLNKRLYDPIVGQWMTPAWEQLATKLTTPADVFIYRFQNNDPINQFVDYMYMNDLNSWLQLYGYDIKSILGSEYLDRLVFKPQATVSSKQLIPNFGVMSGLQSIIDRINEKFAHIEFPPEPVYEMKSTTRYLPQVAFREPIFGEGILISHIDGRALVTAATDIDDVLGDVITSVFNNSFFLEVYFSIYSQDIFYFIKDDSLKISDDLKKLKRLENVFNVSTHETKTSGLATGHELRLQKFDVIVVIKYGADPKEERQRILQNAHKRAVEWAWELEKQMVVAGFKERGNWTDEEKEELISQGYVEGYKGVNIHSTHKYPQLADDPGNIKFKRDSKRVRRKSGQRKSRIH